MTFKEDNLRFAFLKAMIDAAEAELTQMRTDHLLPLLQRYDEDGTLKFSVELPSTGALIGALTLPKPKDKYEVTDEAAFTAWFAENHPDAVTVEIIPGEPEHTVVVPATPDEKVTTINPRNRSAILKALDQTDDGKIVDTVTGSFVQGVTFRPGNRPKSFSVTYEPRGRDLLAAAYRAGELDAIVAGTALPPVNGRVTIERVAVPVETTPPAPAAVDDLLDRWGKAEGADADALYPEDVDTTEPATDDWSGAVIGGDGKDFDPGHWGAPYGGAGRGW